MKPFKITEANDGMLRVTVKGEDPFYLKPSEGLSREEAIHEAASFVMRRNTRKHLNMLSSSLAIADELLSELASERSEAPPAIAEAMISVFAPKRFSDAQLGDMQEIFEANVKRHGLARAKRLYWYEVARSIGPVFFHWLKRIGFIAVLVDYGRKKIGL